MDAFERRLEPTAGFEPASSFEVRLQSACFQPLSHVGVLQLKRELLLDGWYFLQLGVGPWRERYNLLALLGSEAHRTSAAAVERPERWGERVTIRAEKREVRRRVVAPIAVDVLDLKRNPTRTGMPLMPTTA
jgi:hypothetical protein